MADDNIFHVLICHLCIFFGEISLHAFCPFFNRIASCIILEFWESFIYSRYNYLLPISLPPLKKKLYLIYVCNFSLLGAFVCLHLSWHLLPSTVAPLCTRLPPVEPEPTYSLAFLACPAMPAFQSTSEVGMILGFWSDPEPRVVPMSRPAWPQPAFFSLIERTENREGDLLPVMQ